MAPSLGMFSSDETDKSLKEKISSAIRHLESQRKELELLRSRLEERRKTMFEATIKAIEKSDERRARVLSGEHIELQKISKVVNASELALLHICVRLETIRDVGDIVFVLSNAFRTVKKVGKAVQQVTPHLEQTASEINGSFSSILSELGMISPNVNISLSDTPNDIFHKAQQLIEERTSELANLPKTMEGQSDAEGGTVFEKAKRIALLATEEIDEEGDTSNDTDEFKPLLFSGSALLQSDGEVPIDPENAVRNLLSQGGVSKFDVLDASAQLNLPVDLVEQAYIKVLAEKAFPGSSSTPTKHVKK